MRSSHPEVTRTHISKHMDQCALLHGFSLVGMRPMSSKTNILSMPGIATSHKVSAVQDICIFIVSFYYEHCNIFLDFLFNLPDGIFLYFLFERL